MVANPYNAQTISGYNSSPPADDGTQIASNQLEWQKHLDKIGDPVKTLSEAINTELLSAFQLTINTATDQDNHIDGSLALTHGSGTVATDALANPTRSSFYLHTQGATKYDDLSQITVTTTATLGGGEVRDGGLMFLRLGSATEVIRVRDGAGAGGSIRLTGGRDAWLSATDEVLFLQRSGTDFEEVARPANQFGGDRGYIDGFRIRNGNLAAAPNLSFFGGQALFNPATGYTSRMFETSSFFRKDVTATWATGDLVGGLGLGITSTASQDIHCFAIGRYDGYVDYGFDTSTSATALLEAATDYFWQRRVASVRLSATGGIRNIRTSEDGWTYLPRPLIEISKEEITTGTDRYATISNVPFNMGFRTRFVAMLENDGSTTTDNANVRFDNTDHNLSELLVDDNDFTLRLLGSTATAIPQVTTVHFQEFTAASASATEGGLRYRSDLTATNIFLSLWTVAYKDERGRDAT